MGGAVRELDPSTGGIGWEQPLPCPVVGSPTLNGVTQVLAVPQFNCPAGVAPSVRFFDATTGTPAGQLTVRASIFAQPVFAAGHLFVAEGGGVLTAYAP